MSWIPIEEYNKETHGTNVLVIFRVEDEFPISAHYVSGTWFIDCEDGIPRTCSPLLFKGKQCTR